MSESAILKLVVADIDLAICILVVVHGLLEAFGAEPKHVGNITQADLDTTS